MKVLHTGDLHITGGLGNDETDSIKALGKISHIAKTEQVRFVHLNGDIFDSKSNPIQRKTFKVFLKNLQSIESLEAIFIIPGNHDERHDLDIYHEPDNNIFCITEPEWRVVDNYAVCFIPHFNAAGIAATAARESDIGRDGTDTFSNLINVVVNQAYSYDSTYIKALVFHGTVGGASLDNDFIPRENGIHLKPALLKTFPGLCIGGHYHKYQRIDESNVYYSGAPVRHTFGELGKKGVIVVDYLTHDDPIVEFIEIEQRPCYVLKGEFKDGQVVWENPDDVAAAKLGGDVKVDIKVNKHDIATMKASEYLDGFADTHMLTINTQVNVMETVRCNDISEESTVSGAFALWLKQTGYDDESVNYYLKILNDIINQS